MEHQRVEYLTHTFQIHNHRVLRRSVTVAHTKIIVQTQYKSFLLIPQPRAIHLVRSKVLWFNLFLISLKWFSQYSLFVLVIE